MDGSRSSSRLASMLFIDGGDVWAGGGGALLVRKASRRTRTLSGIAAGDGAAAFTVTCDVD